MAFWEKYGAQHALMYLTGHCQIVSQGEGCIVVGGLQVGEITVATHSEYYLVHGNKSEEKTEIV